MCEVRNKVMCEYIQRTPRFGKAAPDGPESSSDAPAPGCDFEKLILLKHSAAPGTISIKGRGSWNESFSFGMRRNDNHGRMNFIHFLAQCEFKIVK
jgi:hypothetical protein